MSQPAGGHISAAVAALDFSVGFGFKTVATPTAITKTKTINPATAPSHLLALLPDFGYVGIKEGSTVDGGMESGFGPEELRLPSITGGGGGGGTSDVVKDVNKAVVAGDAKKAKELLPLAYKAIDKAAKRGVIKDNTASRKKSRLTAKVKAAGAK